MPRPVFVPMPSASSSHFIDCCISQATATGPFTGREPCHSSIHLLGCVHPPEGRGRVKTLTSGAQLNEKSTEYPVFQSAYINEYVSWVLLLVTASNSEHTTHSRCVCVSIHTYVCMYLEAIGWCLVSSSIALHFIFWDTVSYWICILLIG